MKRPPTSSERQMNPQPIFTPKSAGLTCGLALALAAFNTGCVSTDETVYRDQERIKVEFENDTAGRLFYEALSQSRATHPRKESSTELNIPVVFHHKHRVVDGENFGFNQAVQRCDTNGDGRITELEARIFSEAAGKHL